jgi:3-dehydroquinate synthetase
VNLLKRFELPVLLGEEFSSDEVMRIARMDKKFEKGRIRFVLLRKAGDAYLSKDVLEGHLINALDELRKPV